MSFFNGQASLPLTGGVVQAQRLVVPTQVVMGLKTWRHACRMAYRLARRRGVTQAHLAQLTPLYAPHISNYFSARENRRELPAKHIAIVESVFGNTVMSQWIAQQSTLHVLEELQATQAHQRRQA
jgi:hypothetical protein